jgi:adenosylcobinamide-phosphate synthase
MHPIVAPLALAVERFFGYPQFLLRAFGHPVMWFGALIDALDRRLNRPALAGSRRKLNGVLMLLVLVLAAVVPAILVSTLISRLPLGWLGEALLATPFLAQKELGRAVAAVADALDRSLPAGRTAVSHIVGRDPETLDEAGVARAAVESLAESLSDGIIAPLFWLMLLGLPGIALYKAVNPADSMVGHKSPRHLDFGWASARLDDVLNWVPARLSALLVAGAALFTTGAAGETAWSTALSDAPRHDSPNAGWPEAAMAGALGFGLGGPRSYDGVLVDLPAMGHGRRDLNADDIRAALRLYRTTLTLALLATLLVAAIGLARGYV